ncbi:JAB domain-containing protein [Coxiella burnetii]|uniref:JAB domain-containing protein n=1 Tax=Coxiella burnetii TaxID=777 RepID=UPI0009BAB063
MINQASVHPREIIKRALYHNSAALIVAHNHPSGVPDPSQADRAATTHLKEALALIDVRLLDHIIIGDRNSFSFAESGLL